MPKSAEIVNRYIDVLTSKQKTLTPRLEKTLFATRQELANFIQWTAIVDDIEILNVDLIRDYLDGVTNYQSESRTLAVILKKFLKYCFEKSILKYDFSSVVKVKSKNLITKKVNSVASNLKILSEGKIKKIESQISRRKEERLKVIKEIKEARLDKDFRENAPLEYAQQKLSQIESQISEQEFILRNSISMKEQKITKSEIIGLGSKVNLTFSEGKHKKSFELVDSEESDPVSGKISTESPIGKALMGRKLNDKIIVQIPKGETEFTIKEIN
tara:strand:- start:492 stop:1307 length:816 start_codon:yes stop_codon:yes gene_type:complete